MPGKGPVFEIQKFSFSPWGHRVISCLFCYFWLPQKLESGSLIALLLSSLRMHFSPVSSRNDESFFSFGERLLEATEIEEQQHLHFVHWNLNTMIIISVRRDMRCYFFSLISWWPLVCQVGCPVWSWYSDLSLVTSLDIGKWGGESGSHSPAPSYTPLTYFLPSLIITS